MSHTIPSTLAPGQHLVVGVTMRNTGNITWTPETNHSLGVEFMSGSQIVTSTRFSINPGEFVSPNQTMQFIVQLDAAASPGSGTVRFRMLQEFVEWFGQNLQLTIPIQSPPNFTADWAKYE